ncbi:MAG: molybdopterin-dependent oxidoreductase [Myxococcales bacterium]|nr:molybdopterin-dependent oxidoreductase [Myxococcales bacterium]
MELQNSLLRRQFLKNAIAGTVIAGFGGGLYVIASDSETRAARAQRLPDGRPRLPPGQRVISALKPMGGEQGDPRPSAFSLKVYGEVENPIVLTFSELVSAESVTQRSDVHCVTGWSLLDAQWRGVQLRTLLTRAGLKSEARHVILEAAHGYTANIRLVDAMSFDSLIAWEHDDKALGKSHGAPVRAVIPRLYFWKSAKWITGIRVTHRDEPGYWEVRGYNNRADPWKEERYA